MGFATSTKILEKESDYDSFLSAQIGLNKDNLAIIAELLFADESRKTFLWLPEIEKFVLDLLTSKESSAKLALTEYNLSKAKDVLRRKEDSLKKIIVENEKDLEELKSVNAEIQKIDASDLGKAAVNLQNIIIERENIKGKIANVTLQLQHILTEKNSSLGSLERVYAELEALKLKKEVLQKEALKAFLHSSEDSEIHHLASCVYYDKKCPICYSDISVEINTRLETQDCPLCGKGNLPGDSNIIDEAKTKVLDIKIAQKQLDEESSKLKDKITQLDNSILILSKEIEAYNTAENNISEIIAKKQSIDEVLLDKAILKRQIKEKENIIKNNQVEFDNITKDIELSKIDIDTLNSSRLKQIQSSKTECNQLLSEVKQRFSTFISIALNGDRTGSLTDQLVPIFDGRQIFDPSVVSQSEKVIIDYAFRIALLSTCAETNGTILSLVLETPDEIIDRSYLPTLPKAIRHFSKNLSIIITTLNPQLIDLLLDGYDIRGKDGRRLTNLLPIQGTLTQKKCFETELMKFLSDSNGSN